MKNGPTIVKVNWSDIGYYSRDLFGVQTHHLHGRRKPLNIVIQKNRSPADIPGGCMPKINNDILVTVIMAT
jgi:hypothetical protein